MQPGSGEGSGAGRRRGRVVTNPAPSGRRARACRPCAVRPLARPYAAAGPGPWRSARRRRARCSADCSPSVRQPYAALRPVRRPFACRSSGRPRSARRSASAALLPLLGRPSAAGVRPGLFLDAARPGRAPWAAPPGTLRRPAAAARCSVARWSVARVVQRAPVARRVPLLGCSGRGVSWSWSGCSVVWLFGCFGCGCAGCSGFFGAGFLPGAGAGAGAGGRVRGRAGGARVGGAGAGRLLGFGSAGAGVCCCCCGSRRLVAGSSAGVCRLARVGLGPGLGVGSGRLRVRPGPDLT